MLLDDLKKYINHNLYDFSNYILGDGICDNSFLFRGWEIINHDNELDDDYDHTYTIYYTTIIKVDNVFYRVSWENSSFGGLDIDMDNIQAVEPKEETVIVYRRVEDGS